MTDVIQDGEFIKTEIILTHQPQLIAWSRPGPWQLEIDGGLMTFRRPRPQVGRSVIELCYHLVNDPSSIGLRYELIWN